MAIGLKKWNTDTFVRANQVGDWVLRAERIELRIGVGTYNALVFTKKEYQKIQKHFEGNSSLLFGSKI